MTLFPHKRQIPAWLFSFVLHCLVFIVLAIALRFAPQGVARETNRSVGIALVKQEQGEREYVYTDQQSEQTESSSTPAVNIADALPKQADVAIDLNGILPSADEPILGNSDLQITDATSLNGGTKSGMRGTQGVTTTSVFGVSGTGSKFVYVFDRSGSMSGSRMAAAKRELLQSLNDLEEIHKFQVIFYNKRPSIFKQGGGRAQLMWGDEASKEAAMNFVLGIPAEGATEHMAALKLALGIRPDVIFFLTDADDQLTTYQLQRIQSLNGNTMINAIEFGVGPRSPGDNFLLRLARQNGGQHVYIDTRYLEP